MGVTYSQAVTFTNAGYSYYQVFVTTMGPSGNLGDGDVKRTTLVNPTKMAPCLAQETDSSATYYTKNVTWAVTDTTLTASVYLTAPATVGPLRHCLICHRTRFEPSFLELFVNL